ncbi:MAG TPA: DUF2480 family protein [Chitinophagaceae bacterium]|nr:DUF2480 family protein [Chitinophagaceae bacterium]
MGVIVNKVAQSGIITLDLENFKYKEEILSFDLEPFLFKGMILREKDFRQAVKEFDWSIYENKKVAVFCSADAIIPMWAYMLITTYLNGVNGKAIFGKPEEVEEVLLKENIQAINEEEYQDKRVVIKGCSDKPLPESAYVEISKKLLPVVKTLMFGEPCSTVPVYKQKKK